MVKIKITHMMDPWDFPLVIPRDEIDSNHVVVLPNGLKAVWGNGRCGKRVRTNAAVPELVIDPNVSEFLTIGVQRKKKARAW